MADVALTVSDGIATVLLNRPDHLNAFTDDMEAGLVAALDRTDADDAVRVVVITGAGRAFCAGADLGDGPEPFADWRASPTAPADTQLAVEGEDLPLRRDGGGRVALRIFASLKPVIAAVNGPAVGVGATMILACDLRLAADAARFGFVFTRRGVSPEACSSWFLPRVVGPQVAMEWMLTGRVFPADEALAHGLVRSVHPAAELLPAAEALAREIAANTAPVSVAVTRRLLWHGLTAADPMEAHYAETLALNARGVSADAVEGIGAFFDKRAAAFPDRVGRDLPSVSAHLAPAAFDPARLRLPR